VAEDALSYPSQFHLASTVIRGTPNTVSMNQQLSPNTTLSHYRIVSKLGVGEGAKFTGRGLKRPGSDFSTLGD